MRIFATRFFFPLNIHVIHAGCYMNGTSLLKADTARISLRAMCVSKLIRILVFFTSNSHNVVCLIIRSSRLRDRGIEWDYSIVYTYGLITVSNLLYTSETLQYSRIRIISHLQQKRIDKRQCIRLIELNEMKIKLRKTKNLMQNYKLDSVNK